MKFDNFLINKNNYVKHINIFKICIPIIIQNLTQQAQIIIDRIFLGNLNSEYFSAIGNVITPYFMSISVLTALITGTTIIVAQNLGAKRYEQVEAYTNTSFKFNTIVSICFFFMWYFFSNQFLILMGVKQPILGYCKEYIAILSFSLLIFGIENTSIAVLIGIGKTKPIMYLGVVKNLINILLDWLLIFGSFGFPALGIAGAAYATTISTLLIGPLFLIILFKDRNKNFIIDFKCIIIAPLKKYIEIIKISIPASIEVLLWSLGNLIIIRILNSISMTYTGIFTLIAGIEIIPYFLSIGFAKAAVTLVGQNFGAKNYREAKTMGLLSLFYILLIFILPAFLFLSFPWNVLRIFTYDYKLIIAAIPYLMLLGIIIFPRAINIVIGDSIRGLGKTRWMMYTQVFGTLFTIVFSFLFMVVLKLDMLFLYIIILSDELIRGAVNLLKFIKSTKPIALKT